ncbi:hypothetical protein GCM10025865_06070 [Paraoerskovia sediminicola]|uniref:Redox-sensing transcriptional repressor Rex n=1 Tax=Paraoerskovia sediminicola TaxID=1138587 RepID=A0ABM8FZY9_9CELL|nr:redox-sensing transcriptional repressor Rex [Paraoerskovia sediminicola]BDZ41308.1 hypothetical protein GCM10025865_06070 [Paraoerskovia sediminicola]
MDSRGDSDAGVAEAPIPPATVRRLPSYLRALHGLAERGEERTRSAALAELSGVSPAQLRKDLSFLGSFGTRGVGYDVSELAQYITATLGIETEHRVAIFGIGDLGHALANYPGYSRRGFEVVALFDAAPEIIGTEVAGIVVHGRGDVARVLAEERVTLAVIATPASVAQAATDEAVEAGIRGILSFAPVSLQVPEHVDVRTIDVSSELQILAFHLQAGQIPTRVPGATAAGDTDRV